MLLWSVIVINDTVYAMLLWYWYCTMVLWHYDANTMILQYWWYDDATILYMLLWCYTMILCYTTVWYSATTWYCTIKLWYCQNYAIIILSCNDATVIMCPYNGTVILQYAIIILSCYLTLLWYCDTVLWYCYTTVWPCYYDAMILWYRDTMYASIILLYMILSIIWWYYATSVTVILWYSTAILRYYKTTVWYSRESCRSFRTQLRIVV